MSEGFLTEDEVSQLTSCGKPLLEWPDGGGLYLRVFQTGTRSWVFRHESLRSPKPRCVLTLGRWPKFSLAEARRWRRACQLKLKSDRRGDKDAVRRRSS